MVEFEALGISKLKSASSRIIVRISNSVEIESKNYNEVEYVVSDCGSDTLYIKINSAREVYQRCSYKRIQLQMRS